MNAHLPRKCFIALAGLMVSVVCTACAPAPKPKPWTGPDTRDLCRPFYDPDVLAVCDPPLGWRADPLKVSATHTHQVWMSPSGATAYGAIHIRMPLPVGASLAMDGFLDQMLKSEGEARLLSQHDEPGLPGITFTAEGGLYRIEVNLMVSGWDCWAFYAGALRSRPVNPAELDEACRARDFSRPGLRADSHPQTKP